MSRICLRISSSKTSLEELFWRGRLFIIVVSHTGQMPVSYSARYSLLCRVQSTGGQHIGSLIPSLYETSLQLAYYPAFAALDLPSAHHSYRQSMLLLPSSPPLHGADLIVTVSRQLATAIIFYAMADTLASLMARNISTTKGTTMALPRALVRCTLSGTPSSTPTHLGSGRTHPLDQYEAPRADCVCIPGSQGICSDPLLLHRSPWAWATTQTLSLRCGASTAQAGITNGCAS